MKNRKKMNNEICIQARQQAFKLSCCQIITFEYTYRRQFTDLHAVRVFTK